MNIHTLTALALIGAPVLLQAEDAPSTLTTPPGAPATAALTAPAAASSPAWGVFVAPNIGTLGAGLEAGYEWNAYFKLRARANWIGYDFDKDRSSIHYKAKAANMNGGLMLDCHPWAGTFRVTAGLLISNLNARVDGSTDLGTAGGNITLGDDTYQAEGLVGVHGKYTWNKVQPYIGIGWSTDGEGDRSWYVTADIGVAILGSGKLTTSHSGSIKNAAGNPASDAQINGSIRREADDVLKICDKLTVYPVVQIGVGYRF